MSGALAGLLLLVASASPGDQGHPPFMCHTEAASVQYADVPTDDDAIIMDAVLSLLRRRECVYFPPAIRPTVTFQRLAQHRAEANVDVWVVRWGQEDWYVAVDVPRPREESP